MDSLWERPTETMSLAEVRGQLERRVWGSVMLLLMVLTPLSLLRVVDTGWLPIYTVHTALFAVMATVHLCKRWISSHWRVLIALAYLQIAGTLGLVLMGFLGFGYLWLTANCYLIAVMYGHRAGLYAIAGCVVTVLIAMLGFRHDLLALPVHADTYMHSATTWLLGVIMMVLLPWTLLSSVGLYKEAVVNLLRKTEQQRQEIERLATHDHLTGLAQQRVAHERLSIAMNRAHRSINKVGVLFIDLDGFKSVNDLHGHAAGDHVLRTVGNVLRSVVRDSDTVSRIGGDEFLVVLEDLVDRDIAASVAGRVLHDLSQPIPFHNTVLQIGVSIGIALFPDHAVDAPELQRAADAAMYYVKKNGKGGYAFAGTQVVQRTPEPVEPGETCKVQQLYYR